MEVILGDREVIQTKRLYLNSSTATVSSKALTSEGVYKLGRLTFDIADALVTCRDDEILTASVVKFSCLNNFLKFGDKTLTLSVQNMLGAGNFFEMTYNSAAADYLYNNCSSAEMIEWLNAGLSSAMNTETGDATFKLYGSNLGHQYLGLFRAGTTATNIVIYGEDDTTNPVGVVTGTSRALCRMLGIDPKSSVDLSYDNSAGLGTSITNKTNINLGIPTHFLITSSLIADSYANTEPALRNILAEVPLNFKINTWSPLDETWRYAVNWENINMVGSHKPLSHKNISSLDIDVRLPDGTHCNFANSDWTLELEFKTLSRYKRS
jgi:hypothetical protein